MKPPPLGYSRPESVAGALATLASLGPDAKVLAGGQSLLPLLSMRLAAPGHLVDVNRLAELAYVRASGGEVRVGALARHAQVLADGAAAAAQPLLGQALRWVAHAAIRNRGTVVGSLVHADPAAELPAVLALLDGTVRLASASGERVIAAREFFLGPLESAVRPGELATEAVFPALPPAAGTAFTEVSRRQGDYAVCGVAALAVLGADGGLSRARVACLSVAPVPQVIDVTAAAGNGEPDLAAAAGQVREQVEPEPDLHATAAYRRHLAGVLAQRALAAACRRARQRWQDAGVRT
ncbi:MAG: FAD binding domain-containing protein [Gemmatimonadota bacterium]